MTTRETQPRAGVVIRFAGDSGDGIQLTGSRFTSESALLGNDIVTFPSFPAEIRAPQGTLAGVSSFQIQFADHPIATPGDAPDVLVALNPAALKAHLGAVPAGATLIINTDGFTLRSLAKAGYATDPVTDGSLASWHVHPVAVTTMTSRCLEDIATLTRKERERAGNMFALGLLLWMYGRDTRATQEFVTTKFAGRVAVREANLRALTAGWNYGETSEDFAVQYRVDPAPKPAGTYRSISGNHALALGFVAASGRSGLPLVVGSYPITPASDILHILSGMRRYGVTTIQAEDEIAGAGIALGASFGGGLGVTATSGPGLALKSEMIGLAVSLELPLIVVDVQRGGPSTGLPTKTEQADLLQAMYGRNGESPVAVLAPKSPADCFDVAVEAVRLATTYRVPVIILSDGYLANGTQAWQVPRMRDLPPLTVTFADGANAHDTKGQPVFHPYQRDRVTLARDWAIPGTPHAQHRIGGLEKADVTGHISYDADNHQFMTWLRQAKVSGMVSSIGPLEVDDPTGDADVLVLGWGSTYGPISSAVTELRGRGTPIAQAHLRYLNPLPGNIDETLTRYRVVVVPEMNLGQLADLLRARTLIDIRSHTAVRGTPFTTQELLALLASVAAETPAGSHP